MADWTEIANGFTDHVPNLQLDFGQASAYRLEFIAPIDLPDWLPGMIEGALNFLPGEIHVHAYLSESHTLQIEFSR